MKRYLKKIGALLVASVMVMSLSLTAFAAGETPSSSDKGTITVNKVETGLTVTAYQIVKADYNAQGFTGYSAVKAGSLANPLAPTSDEVTAIAKDVAGLPSVVLSDNGDGSYSADVAPGYWVILVTGSNQTVYNPMLAGLYYSVGGSDNTMASGPVDASSNWTLVTENAYAKSSDVPLEKEIVNPGSQNPKGDDVAIGDTVSFKITTKIPSYSKEYTSATFTIHDTLSAGLTFTDGLQAVLQAKVDADYGAGNAVVTISGQNLSIAFASDYILANGLKDIVIEYTAKLNENAGINFDANTNTVYVEYTNNPSEGGEPAKTPDEITYHYTFGIDAKLNGTDSERTDELFKVDQNGTVKVEGETVTVTNPLAGAEFTLTNKVTGKEYKAVSAADGSLSFTGLDAGEYTLVETKTSGWIYTEYKRISGSYQCNI
ncbi:MAG: isopeptide-forming domain-containing fimbrial protein [Muricomes sp.]